MSDLIDMIRDMSQLHAELTQGRADQRYRPMADSWEEPEAFRLELDLPGVGAEQLSLDVEHHTLTVRAERPAPEGDGRRYSERRYGRYERSFRLPEGVDVDAIEAKLEHGVLHVRLPKRAEIQPRKIQIQVQGKAAGPRAIEAGAGNDSRAA